MPCCPTQYISWLFYTTFNPQSQSVIFPITSVVLNSSNILANESKNLQFILVEKSLSLLLNTDMAIFLKHFMLTFLSDRLLQGFGKRYPQICRAPSQGGRSLFASMYNLPLQTD